MLGAQMLQYGATGGATNRNLGMQIADGPIEHKPPPPLPGCTAHLMRALLP